jgi:3-oxoacyl-[acyl-carrier-protein] synthase II
VRGEVVVTGLALWSPLGSTETEVLEALRLGRCGIGPLAMVDSGRLRTRHAAQIRDFAAQRFFSAADSRRLDRATQLAVVVAARALDSAGIRGAAVPPERIGLCVGTSGAGQFQNMQFWPSGEPVVNRAAALYHARNVTYFHAEVLAARLGLHGPVASFASASVGSALALARARDLVRSGRADVVLAGGSETLTAAGLVAMDSLDLSTPEPCAPFSGRSGMTFGEGAAFFVLESLESARRRAAHIWGEILGVGVHSDAYDAVSNDPAGRGLSRSLRAALHEAGITPGQVGFVKASGTGLAAHDRAEAFALRQVFDGCLPPTTSFERAFGHANGAAPALGLAGALLCQRAGLVPPVAGNGGDVTLLDVVVSRATPAPSPVAVCNSVAFGGQNAVLVVAQRGLRRRVPRDLSASVGISGIGVVSAAGSDLDAFAEALRSGRSAIAAIDRFQVPASGPRRAGLVSLAPGAALGRRADRLKQYAAAAASSALRDAGLLDDPSRLERVGLIVALSRGPVAAQERFFTTMRRNERITPALGRAMLEMGSFSVASAVSAALKLGGFCATISEGITAGLHALVHACDRLRLDAHDDAIVVVAADEIGALFHQLYDRLGLLAADGRILPYNSRARGTVLGEGAVAIVVEREPSVRARRSRFRASVDGCGLTADGRGFGRAEPEGVQLTRAMALALGEARAAVSDLDAVYGHGCGLRAYDAREAAALRRLLEGRPVPASCVTGTTGMAEAASGLFSVVGATLGMARGEIYPIPGDGDGGGVCWVRNEVTRASVRRTLVAGSTQSGNNAAVLLGTGDA